MEWERVPLQATTMCNKGFNQVTETEEISYECDDGFTLIFASMKMSNSGTYRPTVAVSRDPEENNVEHIFA